MQYTPKTKPPLVNTWFLNVYKDLTLICDAWLSLVYPVWVFKYVVCIGPSLTLHYHSPKAAGTAARGWGTCRCSSRRVRTDRRSRPAGRRWRGSRERPLRSTLAGHTPPLAPGTWYPPASTGTGRGTRGKEGEWGGGRSAWGRCKVKNLFVKNIVLRPLVFQRVFGPWNSKTQPDTYNTLHTQT